MLENRKDSIGNIMDGLHQVHEGVSLINEDPFIKSINKAFGRITKMKEVWSEDGVSDLADIKTKNLSINTNDEDIEVGKLLEFLKKKPVIELDYIPQVIHRLFKVRYSIENISNFRIILNRMNKKRVRIEIRYDRRILNQNDMNVLDAKEEAEFYKEEDKLNIEPKVQFVLDALSITPKPIQKSPTSVEDIQKESGCDLETAKKVSVIADKLFNDSLKQEPKITRDIINIVKRYHGSMYGLDYRLKQGTSLGRKIASDALDPNTGFNGDLEASARDVKDSIRYTAVFDRDDFVTGYLAVKKELTSMGYREFRCKNFYLMYREGNSQQKALQCVYESSEGLLFELQFHTPESQGAKEVNHPLYEAYRSADTSISEKRVLDMRMVNISDNVPDPEGIYDILSHK